MKSIKSIIHILIFPVILTVVITGHPKIIRAEEEVSALQPGDMDYLRILLETRLNSETPGAREKTILQRLHQAATALIQVEQQQKADPPRIPRGELEQKLRDQLRTEVADNPQGRSARLELARYYIYQEDPRRALTQLDRSGPASKEDIFWQILKAYCHLRLGEHETAAPLLQSIIQTADLLMPLRLQQIHFCNRVTGLAQYEPRQNNFFKAGERTVLYFEVAGAEFTPGGNDLLRIHFNISLEIRDEMQRTVWSAPNYADHNLNYTRELREIFMSDPMFMVPNNLGAGKYNLLIHYRDMNSHQQTSGSIDFTVQ